MGSAGTYAEVDDGASLRQRRRAAILDAAEALFLEQGYEHSSLAEIVRRSGGSLSTLYELFGNKQGLLRAIADRWRDEAVGDCSVAGGESSRSKAEMLTGYALRRARSMRSSRSIALMRMLISESLRDRTFAQQTYQELHLPAVAELSALFTEWTASGYAEIDDCE